MLDIETVDDGNTKVDEPKASTALECFKTLLESGTMADFTFVVGGKEFAVHKNILAARSPVFARMFEHEMREQIESRLELTDVEVGVFGELLRYIYSGKVPDMDKFASDLFVAADKVK